MYLRRHCYNKPHRCAGWSGGGWRGTYDDHKPANWDELHNEDGNYPWEESSIRRRHWWQARDRCHGGSIWTRYLDDPWMNFRFGRCYKCDIRTVPLITQWVDPTYLWYLLRHRIDWTFEEYRVTIGRRGFVKGTIATIRYRLWSVGYALKNKYKSLYYWYAPSRRAQKLADIAALKARYGIN